MENQMAPNLQTVSHNQDLQVSDENSRILLLYRRDDAITKKHVAALHYKLKKMNFQVKIRTTIKGLIAQFISHSIFVEY